MNKKIAKVVRIVAIVFLVIVLLLSIASTVLMFQDQSGSYRNNYSYYGSSFTYTYYYVSYPESGIMPLFGTVCLVIALLLLISSKKKSKRAIGTMFFIFVAQLLLFLSVLVSQKSYYAVTGWTIAVVAASNAFIPFILTIVYLVVSLSKGGEKKEAFSSVNYSKMAQNLKEIKDLYDSGIFSEAEFKNEKESLFRAYGVTLASVSTLNGVYVCMNSKIAISDNVFSMTYDGRIVKVGTVTERGEDVVLVGEDGKELTMKTSGSALVTEKGTRYEKE